MHKALMGAMLLASCAVTLPTFAQKGAKPNMVCSECDLPPDDPGDPGPSPDPGPYTQPSPGASGTWTYTGALNHDRAFDGGSGLANNGALVSAGVNSDGVTISNSEVFNGSSWTYTGNLNHDRKYHTQTTLLDGSVLVTGGENNDGETIRTAELWNPNTGAWTYVGNLAHDRAFHTATLLVHSGKVLLTGGINNDHNTIANAELYDPATRQFTAISNLQHDRANHTATLIPYYNSPTGEDIVVIAGGHNDDPDPTHSAETYDAASQTFTLTANSLQQDRSNHGAVYLPGLNKVLVAGGMNSQIVHQGKQPTIHSAELYDPASRTWSFTGDLVHDRQYLTLNVLPNGNAIAAGGRNYDDNTVQYAEIFNTASGGWANTGYLNHDRANEPGINLSDGTILVSGGRNNDGDTIHSAEIYHP